VRRANDGVLAGIDPTSFFLAAGLPHSKKYETLVLVIQFLNHSVRKVFPSAFLCITVGLSAADRQNSIEKQDTLFPRLSCHARELQCQHLRGLTKDILFTAALSHLCEPKMPVRGPVQAVVRILPPQSRP
jgi:hypothetical protein